MSPDAGPAESRARRRRHFVRTVVRAPDSYGLVLALLVADYVILSLELTGASASVSAVVVTVLTSLLAAHTSQVRGRPLRALWIVAAAAVTASLVVAADEGRTGRGVVFSLVAVLVVSSLVAIATRIIRHPDVSAETLLGAICIYVLIGLVFAYADYAVQLLGGHFFAQPGEHSGSDFAYFSFVTMTTVGYGDLSPGGGLPRSMAVLEALTGQIFLVVLVARLVALYSPSRNRGRLATLRDDAAATGGAGGAPEADGPDGSPAAAP